MPDPVPADGCDRLIYLHGFRSSPRSIKAQMLARRMAQAGRATDFVCPALPDSPAAAIAMILDSIRPTPGDVVVGSSLGGFYARYVAEQILPGGAIGPDEADGDAGGDRGTRPGIRGHERAPP